MLVYDDYRQDLIGSLIEEELISAAHLRHITQEVTQRCFLHLFGLNQGKIKGSPYSRPKEPKKLTLSPLRLALMGVYDSYDRLRLYECFGHLKTRPYTSQKRSLYREELNESELLLFSLADGSKTISELAQETTLDPLYVLSFYYVFSLLDEIKIQQNNILNQYYQRAIEQDYFQLLSLDYSATQDQIKDAWQTHRQWLKQQNEPNQNQIRLLTQILDDAYRILAYESLKNRYLDALQQPIYTPESSRPNQVDS
jgi:hypothetical protein